MKKIFGLFLSLILFPQCSLINSATNDEDFDDQTLCTAYISQSDGEVLVTDDEGNRFTFQSNTDVDTE